MSLIHLTSLAEIPVMALKIIFRPNSLFMDQANATLNYQVITLSYYCR